MITDNKDRGGNTVATFNDLEFGPHPNWPDGVQARIGFDNGYSASVVKGRYSYGGPEGLYELAIFADGKLCYDTPITSDVKGSLSPDDVTDLLRRIEELPQRQPVLS